MAHIIADVMTRDPAIGEDSGSALTDVCAAGGTPNLEQGPRPTYTC